MKINLIIRKAKIDDKEGLIKLIRNEDYRTKEWAEIRVKSFVLNKNPNKFILIAFDGKKMLGYIGVKKYDNNKARKFKNLDNCCWITWIAVLPSYRMKKIGSKLINRAIIYSKKFNKKYILLHCRKKYIPFYEKNGFKSIGKFIDKGESKYVLERKLK